MGEWAYLFSYVQNMNSAIVYWINVKIFQKEDDLVAYQRIPELSQKSIVAIRCAISPVVKKLTQQLMPLMHNYLT